jgi:CheY-like chemotaxis protein
MSDTRRRILVVDDEPEICGAIAMLLDEDGYDVSTAIHGFDALLQLRVMTPDMIISDLNMPQMSGFEFLSVVRCRFPSIPVIAMSGAFAQGDWISGGVIADGFYSKGRCHPDELLQLVNELIHGTVTRPADKQRRPATLQLPRYGADSKGAPFIVLTCTECLRSFRLSGGQGGRHDVQEAHCQFCATSFLYMNSAAPAYAPEQVIVTQQLAGESTPEPANHEYARRVSSYSTMSPGAA